MLGYSLQLTPDMKYLIAVRSAPRDGDSAIANTGKEPILNLAPSTEHWSLTPAFLDALQSAKAGDVLTLQGAKLESPPTGFPVDHAYPMFTLPTDVVWTAMTEAPRGDLWLGRATGSVETVSMVGIDFASLVPPRSETGAWRGSVTWYVRSSSAQPPSGPVVDDGTTTLSYAKIASVTSAEAEVFWFSVTLRPQAPSS